jgi:hypothetical protein
LEHVEAADWKRFYPREEPVCQAECDTPSIGGIKAPNASGPKMRGLPLSVAILLRSLLASHIQSFLDFQNRDRVWQQV